jgi:hypothetical protein
LAVGEVDGFARFNQQRRTTAVAHCDTIADVPADSCIEVVDMSGKPVSIDRDELARRYLAGESTPTLAKAYGCCIATIARLLSDAGVQLRSHAEAVRLAKGVTIDIEDIAHRHIAGESVNALAKSFGVSRPAIVRRLSAAGVPVRGSSDANRLRMQGLSPDQRRRLTSSANAAARTGNVSMADRDPGHERPTISSALRRCRKVGQGEAELIDLIIARGIAVETQLPVYGYNLDIAVESVAVEVWWGNSYPLRYRRQARRTVQLADLGWSTVFVWLSQQAPTAECADAVIAFVEEMSRRPPSVRPQYRVVRSNGELVSAGEAQFDHLALVPTASDGTYRAKLDDGVAP